MSKHRAIGAFLACVTLLTMQSQQQGSLSANDGQQRGAAPAGAGRGDAGAASPGIDGALLTGAWGAKPLALDARGWGWLTQSYVRDGYQRPFWNKAKEMLFSGKQVTSYTIDRFDSALYCE